MYEDLTPPDAILADCWVRLATGAADPGSPFHTPALATADEIAGVTVRTVVLRRVDPMQRVLLFHTDRRSPKFESLYHERKAAWLFYDPAAKLQLRIQSNTTLHTKDAIAHELWTAAPAATRAMYGGPHAPGTPLPELSSAPPAPVSDGRDNFAVVRCVVNEIDWLLLRADGHRRIQFKFVEGRMLSTWLAP